MRTTFRQWFKVMHFSYWNKDSFLKTSLTERMLLDVAVTNPLPDSSVYSFRLGISDKLLVTSALILSVLFAEPFGGKVWTARMPARLHRFPWHLLPPSKRKTPKEIPPRSVLFYLFPRYHITTYPLGHCWTFTALNLLP